eukprot:s2267_g2.t1
MVITGELKPRRRELDHYGPVILRYSESTCSPWLPTFNIPGLNKVSTNHWPVASPARRYPLMTGLSSRGVGIRGDRSKRCSLSNNGRMVWDQLIFC